MSDQMDFKLIQYTDPNKVKIPINNRFAKLTLSSNKKNKNVNKLHGETEGEKHKSVSRNIMSLLNDTELIHSNEDNDENKPVNPLFRSDSSSKSDGKLEFDPDETYLSAEDEKLKNSPPSDHLVSLEIGEDYTKQTKSGTYDEDINHILEQMKSIGVSDNIETKSINNQSIYIDSADFSAITVSDSSDEEPTTDFDLITSDIPTSSDCPEVLLSNSLGNNKAMRMEAFLRDVSQEVRAMQTLQTIENEKLNVSETLGRSAKEIATADTESMSTETVFETEEIANIEAKKILLALDDTKPLSQSHGSIFIEENQYVRYSFGIKRISNAGDENMRGIAHNDTVVNTLLSFEEKCKDSTDSENNEDSFINNKSKSIFVEDSLIISDTSVEEDNEDENKKEIINKESISNENEGEVVVSEEKPILNDSSSSSGISKIQANVNISAKINIKIQISQPDSTDEEENCDDPQCNDYESPQSIINESLKLSEESVANTSVEDKDPVADSEEKQDMNETIGNGEDIVKKTKSNGEHKKQAINIEEKPSPFKIPIITPKRASKNIPKGIKSKQAEELSSYSPSSPINKTPVRSLIKKNKSSNVGSDDEDEENNGKQFEDYAHKLLSELYGNSWKTPEVMKIIKRTSSEVSKSASKTDMAKVKAIKKTPIKSSRKKLNDEDEFTKTVKRSAQKTSCRKQQNDSIADFSMFRHDIVNANMNSTRLDMDKQILKESNTPQRSEHTDKKIFKKPIESSKKPISTNTAQQIEMTKPLVTKRGRVVKERWRNLIDSDTESDTNNASDDSHVDNSDSDWNESNENHNNTKSKRRNNKENNKIQYLDLTHDEVQIVNDPPSSPPANHDENFKLRLEDILKTCRREEKPKLPSSGQKPISKRKLFTPNYNYEDEKTPPQSPKPNGVMDDNGCIKLLGVVPNDDKAIFNKVLEFVKKSEPVFKTPSPKSNKIKTTDKKTPSNSIGTPSTPHTPLSSFKNSDTPLRTINKLCETPRNKYSFLKSLDASAGKMYCHPDALYYRDNYRLKKHELAERLYELYNEKLFENKLDVPLVWNKKLLNTAGRCLNKKKLGNRTSVVELSEKVLTGADRLRCTLVHELCHAATWIFNGASGHGVQWRAWARQANISFPELPPILVCHQYDIEYKYTYKCTLCGAKSHAHSKSKKVENIRCAYCHGAIEIFLNKKDKDGNVIPTPVKEPTGFAKFVKDNYKLYKHPDLTHAELMKLLGSKFSEMKVIS